MEIAHPQTQQLTSLIMQTWNLKILLTNSHYAELQPQKQEKMDNTQIEGQTNNKEH